ncbi:hypothetical protein Pmani_026132 [Petrolisthes manimaculis]|uniref:Uncharacterized protein n=1 Tax=Petrolisthes manimaculis TaxID=1843537 RepID=A0AAE1TWY3_9EUCA|nr:hypothetical protein Pmani_026132 [Petrolisthes manimaculis]
MSASYTPTASFLPSPIPSTSTSSLLLYPHRLLPSFPHSLHLHIQPPPIPPPPPSFLPPFLPPPHPASSYTPTASFLPPPIPSTSVNIPGAIFPRHRSPGSRGRGWVRNLHYLASYPLDLILGGGGWAKEKKREN